MNYIIDPWFFYLIEVSGNIKETIGFIVFCSMIISGVSWFVAILDDVSSTKTIQTAMKVGKWSLFILVISGVFWLFIPSPETLVAMELAGFATVDNVEILIQKIQEAAQYIVDSISK